MLGAQKWRFVIAPHLQSPVVPASPVSYHARQGRDGSAENNMLKSFLRRSTVALILSCLVGLLTGPSGFTYTPPAESGQWTEQSPASHPAARFFHAMAYLGDDKVLLFGGFAFEDEEDPQLLPAETWVYDLSDDSWTLMDPATQPPARSFHAMAYLGDDKALLFGGATAALLFGGFTAEEEEVPQLLLTETWVYDLSDNTWTEMSPDPKPSARVFHAMAYAGWDQALLFGGIFDEDDPQETWLYDLSSNAWTLTDPEVEAPDPRLGHAMAHLGVAESQAAVLLFGGMDGFDDASGMSDTWFFGNPLDLWGREAAGTALSARGYHAMAFLQLGYVVLFGGVDDSDGVDGATWVYDIFTDSSSWVEQEPAAAPAARAGAAMANVGKGVAVLFGGAGDTVDDLYADTWVFRPATCLGITVTPTSGLITTESGDTATFEISANTPPDAAVEVPLSSSDAAEGTVPASVWLPAGSTTPISVTVTGVDDAVIDGDIDFVIITGDPASADLRYDFLEADHVDDVSVTNWDPDAPRIEVRGDNQVIANGDDTPSTADDTHFGTSQLDTPVERTFEISNQADVDLELTGISAIVLQGSGDFAVSDQPSRTTLGPGESVDFTVRCTPSGTGGRQAVVSIRSDDPDDDPFEFTIECSGGDAPEIVVLGNGRVIPNGDTDPSEAKHTVFQLAGDAPVVRTFTISNRGDTELLLHGGPVYATVDHSQFSISRSPDPAIDPGETTTFDVTFIRGSESYVEATVSISNTDDDRNPYTFKIIGAVDGATALTLRADAGPDQILLVGTEVVLDGSGSGDADMASALAGGSSVRPKTLTSYHWEFKVDRFEANSPVWAFPAGSSCFVTGEGFDTPYASFVADVEGTYVLTLEITNSEGETATDEVMVVAVHEFPTPEGFQFEAFVCEPTPFSDAITFGFEGDGLANATSVWVYDLGRHLVWSESARDTNAIVWDGRTSAGEWLANGPYLVVITIYGNGNFFTGKRVIFIHR